MYIMQFNRYFNKINICHRFLPILHMTKAKYSINKNATE